MHPRGRAVSERMLRDMMRPSGAGDPWEPRVGECLLDSLRYWVVLDCVGLYWIVLDCVGFVVRVRQPRMEYLSLCKKPLLQHTH